MGIGEKQATILISLSFFIDELKYFITLYAKGVHDG